MHPDDLQHPHTTLQCGPRPAGNGPGGNGRDGTGLGTGLSVRWLGTAGFELTAAEGHVLLIDPYFTRVGLGRYLFGSISPDPDAVTRGVGRADGVLVGHSHFDHVMDVPLIARRTGSHVFGSRSTSNLLQGLGLPEHQFTALDKDKKTTFEVGPFKVTAIPSLHSRFAIGNNVPYPGDIPCTCDIALRGKDYRCGDVFSFLIDYHGFTLYHLGSANLAEDTIPAEARDVDLLLLCIAARFATERFVPRALSALTPKTVVPMHYDNMWRSPDKPLMLLPRTNFGRLVDDVATFSRSVSVLTLPMATRMPSPPIAPVHFPIDTFESLP